MAWSSFAHLPTSEDEYWSILSNLRNDMTIHDVDATIASSKGKEKVQHHYRSNLAKMGFFKIDHNCIILNYDVKKLLSSRKYLKIIFQNVLKKSQAFEIKEVAKVITKIESYDLQAVIDILEINYPLVERNSFVRWIRPIVSVMKFADVLSMKVREKFPYLKYLQEAFLKNFNEFGNSVPLEVLESELKKIDSSFEVVALLDKVLGDFNARFKIELLMMPSWATKNKSYKVGEDMYTHLKIKTDLKEED